MRVNERFAAIAFVHGGMVFHIALLLASIIVIFFTEDIDGDKRGFLRLINMFRVSHVVTTTYRFIEYGLERS